MAKHTKTPAEIYVGKAKRDIDNKTVGRKTAELWWKSEAEQRASYGLQQKHIDELVDYIVKKFPNVEVE